MKICIQAVEILFHRDSFYFNDLFYVPLILPAYIYMQHVHALCPQRPEVCTIFLGVEVTDSYKLLCWFWKQNLVPLQKQQEYFIAEPSLKPDPQVYSFQYPPLNTFVNLFQVTLTIWKYIKMIPSPGSNIFDP